MNSTCLTSQKVCLFVSNLCPLCSAGCHNVLYRCSLPYFICHAEKSCLHSYEVGVPWEEASNYITELQVTSKHYINGFTCGFEVFKYCY